jgi:hypothetical protein
MLTTAFATVKVGRVPPQAPEQEGVNPSAWVRPVAWSSKAGWSGLASEEKIRELRFEVEITCRRGDGADLSPTLEDLVAVAEDALDGQRILDSIDELTTADEGRYVSSPRSPEQVATLSCRLGYWKVGPREEG